MGRRKIEIKKIENLKARQVCFTKRRKGLFKKVAELSRLVNDVDFLSIVFPPSGTPFTFSTFNDPSSSSSPIDPILDHCVQQPLNSDSRTEIKKKKFLLEINLGDLPENQLESVIKALQTMKLNVLKRLHEIRNTKDDEFDWLGLMNQQVSATIDLENTSTDHQLLLSNGAENTTIDDQGTDFDEGLLNFDFSFFAQDSTSSATEKQIPDPCLELSATSDYDSVLIDNSELFSLVHDSYPPSRITTDHQSDLGINRWWWWWRC